jgi:hypothetical protein
MFFLKLTWEALPICLLFPLHQGHVTFHTTSDAMDAAFTLAFTLYLKNDVSTLALLRLIVA